MRILDGLKVLEVASLGPVPWGGMLLADMGASLIRVDRPDGGPAGADRDPVRRGRSAVRLDLKSAQGRAGFLRLAARADVLMEGMRPGVMERLGVGPGPCLQANPRLVYARMTGWGQAGPLAPRAGHDINYIATTGALHAIGTAQAPVVPLNLVADYGGGGAFLVMGILAAVLQARQSGQGRVLDIAMIDGVASLMTAAYGRLANGSWQDRRAANALDGGAPWYGVYETRDGKHVAVGAVEAPFYQELLEKLALTHLPDRADAAHWPAIRAALAQAFASRTRDEWAGYFADSDACVTPVLSLREAPDHPHNRARGLFASWQGAPTPAPAPRTGDLPAALSPPSHTVPLEQALETWK
ncbi:CaiB/BaiF CoA transferase family protein [Bordetella petrii]|uniref:CaiB/BaiF CoA-transferase family protein n=1 Tax=Bordetella petrii TaxID=94624 RepID=A0ABT7W2J1_9BORD|nr:CaiB/BaiF CoA-transferase family protein [Bordetella petrii]MDM9559423.1 CaiB/BaiF CoA-transferase family protein [Bordetella petrii]